VVVVFAGGDEVMITNIDRYKYECSLYLVQGSTDFHTLRIMKSSLRTVRLVSI
jgi:hypothetical protein